MVLAWDYEEGKPLPLRHFGGYIDTPAPVLDLTQDEQPDMVDHPAHYNAGKFEVIDVIEDWGLDFHLGNAVKYIARAGHKSNAAEDIDKAIWYLTRYQQQGGA